MEQEYMARIGKEKKLGILSVKRPSNPMGAWEWERNVRKQWRLMVAAMKRRERRFQGQKQMSELFGLEFERESLVLGIKKWRGEVSA